MALAVGKPRPRVGIVCGLVLALGASPLVARDDGADGRFSKRDSSHFVLFQDVDIDQSSGLRGSRRFEQDVLKVLETAYRRADSRLGLRPERPITVVVYDPGVFDAQFAGLLKFPVAGFYGGQVHVRGGEIVSKSLVAVLNHEYIHAALDAEGSGLVLPGWFNEGIAEWFEASSAGPGGLPRNQRRVLASAAAQGRFFPLATLGTPAFGHMGPGDAALAYAQSHAFIVFLVDARGDRRFREWVGAVLRGDAFERAFRRTYRDGFAELEQRFLAGWASDSP